MISLALPAPPDPGCSRKASEAGRMAKRPCFTRPHAASDAAEDAHLLLFLQAPNA